MGKKLINSRHVKIYQQTLDSVRESLGRTVQVVIGSGIPTANWDYVNNEPIDPNEAITYDDETITINNVLIKWIDKQKLQWESGGRIEPGDVRLKCKLEDVIASGTSVLNQTYFHICRHVIVDGQKCKVMRPPRKTGLRDLYNIEVILERIQD